MMVHKLLDALINQAPGLYVVPHDSLVQNIVDAIFAAEKFDFGELVLEKNQEAESDTVWKVPSLTEEELDFMEQGLLPLPAPLCWFEFKLGDFSSGLLIWDLMPLPGTKIMPGTPPQHPWKIMRIDFKRETGVGVVDGVTVLSIPGNRHEVHIEGPEAYVQMMRENRGYEDDIISHLLLTRYFTLMLNSASTEIDFVPGHKAKSALAQGKTPLPAHRVVRIIPRHRYPRGTGHHASPRLHWRRSHVRTYSDGHKVVIARCLIGKGELGAVTHEYQVTIVPPLR